MSGYWSLFFEDQNTWSRTLSEACSTIVNYGVEIPWCVCSTSSSVMQVVADYLGVVFLAISAFLGADQWWTIEWSVACSLTALELPIIIKRSKRNWYALLSQVCFLGTGLCWMGCFLEVASGIQGGVVFGGRLYYPAIFLLGIALGGVVHVLNLINAEIYGFGPFEEDNKDTKVMKPLRTFCKSLSYEALLLFAIATFGFPKFEGDTDPVPWICLFPLLSVCKEAKEYFADLEPSSEHKESNGEVPKDRSSPVAEVVKADDKKKDPVAAAAANTTKKAAEATLKTTEKKPAEAPAKTIEKKSEETTKTAEDTTDSPKEECVKSSSLLSKIIGFCQCLLSCFTNWIQRVDERIRALPWECITTITLGLGTHLTGAYIFWTLTQDPIAWALPAILILTPLSLAKFGQKLSKESRTLLMDVATCGVAIGQYYLYKTNIIQAV